MYGSAAGVSAPSDGEFLSLAADSPGDDDWISPWRPLAKYRYAEISVQEFGEAGASSRSYRCVVQPRWVPKFASQWEVMNDQVLRSRPPGVCTISYSFPLRAPGFMTAAYMVSGPDTPYSTVRAAVDCLTPIAVARKARAIVFQAYSDRLNSRLLKRWGCVQHATNLGSNHYIKRLR